MKTMKLALLATAAVAAVTVSARADEVSDLKAQLEALNAVKWEMLEEWSRTRRAPRLAAFLHAWEFQAMKDGA